MLRLSENLFCHEDICNVYVIRSGEEALLIDFGSGDVLDRLPDIGVRRVAGIWMTHHHRDQGQGLPRAAAAGIPVWVPHAEQDLFRNVDDHWQARDLFNSYNNRQDRFSLLEPVAVAGTLHDYATLACGGRLYTIVPTPGHTVGSISVLGEVDGRLVAFTGDLVAAPGKTWSLAALQWGYGDAAGAAASIASLLDLQERHPACLLPSHGQPMAEPDAAIELLAGRLRRLLDWRQENPRLLEWRAHPYQPITRHVLWNRTSLAYSYVLLSDSGKALLVDYGYDFMTGMAAGHDRAARRPWLYTLPILKRDFGVDRIDVVVPTHYHDDHVAGLNLLREVEGTAVWAGANFADVLSRPHRYNLSCLWYDPIIVDRVLPLEQPIAWEEYELALYALPGHTAYAVAIAFEADDLRFLATGDQYKGPEGYQWNYSYHNGFGLGDYRAGAELYRRLAPDMILTGHWEPRSVQPTYLERLEERDAALELLHSELLPEAAQVPDRLLSVQVYPYQATVVAGETLDLEVQIANQSAGPRVLGARIIAPGSWQVSSASHELRLAARSSGVLRFAITPPAGCSTRRARLAVDLTVGGRPAGQRAEALVTVTQRGAAAGTYWVHPRE